MGDATPYWRDLNLRKDQKKTRMKSSRIFFEKGHEEIHGPFCFARKQKKQKGDKIMPNFTNNKIDQAYESFMQQVPGFHRDPPEAEVIQTDLDKSAKNVKKGGRKDDLPKR